MSNYDIERGIKEITETLVKSLRERSERNRSIHDVNEPSELKAIAGSIGYKESWEEYYSKLADEYIEFTYKNPTIYHVVGTFSSELDKAGFHYLSEKESWKNLAAGKYYTTRNGSSLVAFVIGDNWTPERGAGIIGAHIDALTVVLKPLSLKSKVDGYELLGVAPYAGTLSDLWWDRDLGIGGRILIKTPSGSVEQKLVDSTPHPIARIPTLAPHFGAPSQGPFNKETQSVPVIGYSTEDEEPATEEERVSPLYGKHSLKLLRYIAKLASVKVSDILQWDLQLYDIQKGTKGGLNKEFIFAPRIDDRVCSFAALKALIQAQANNELDSDNFSIVGLFDNEEIGSGTRQGAGGGVIESVVSRVSSSFNGSSFPTNTKESVSLVYANSIILSADVTHLLNPNFTQIYLEHHKPVPNQGIAVSLDPNGHMATDSTGLALIQQLASANDDKVQYFQIRNDSRSGGTIGPILSSSTGARTIEVGIPQLSMHSIRAALGTQDVGKGTKFFKGFFTNWRKTYDGFSSDL